ncbi:hypothetical protein [uncultured Alsobacter sp.]|uniref:hypothetical protein n=1 Tax=uncultured Alsobacter sp. TaxID=1748258 RepID=UPI0025ED8EC9|nr:hypothetical protein [uncultured Alsobacter sp.]
MTDEADDKVKRLPVRFRTPRADDNAPTLHIVETWDRSACNHKYRFEGGKMRDATYAIRDGETEVECGLCGTRLDPMFVLRRLATDETQWRRSAERYADEMRRLSARSRTKCEHCGEMTRISRS